MNEQPELPLSQRINHNMNILLFFAGAFAYPSIVFLHRNLGKRYATLQGAVALLLMIIWPIVDPMSDPLPMFHFTCVFLVMCVFQRMQTLTQTGNSVYRFYNGTPRLMKLFGCKDEVRFKRFFEPLIVILTAGMLHAWSPLICSFLIASGIGLAITISAIEVAGNERAAAMHDQLIEQEVLAERFRRSGGK